jgi:hypothetical protein
MTFIEKNPLCNMDDILNSRSIKTQKTLDISYVEEWLKKIGDLRGLFFFYISLTQSQIAKNIASLPELQNSPIVCPELLEKNIPYIKEVISIGAAKTIYDYSSKFEEFVVERNGEMLYKTENYFDINSSWMKSAKLQETIFKDLDTGESDFINKIINSGYDSKLNSIIDDSLSKISTYANLL